MIPTDCIYVYGCMSDALRTQGTLYAHHSAIFGRPFLKRFTYAIGPLSVCPVCLSVLCVKKVGVLWPNGLMDQDAIWYGGRSWTRPHCVRLEPSSPKRGHSSP